jgi:hypothetical protein
VGIHWQQGVKECEPTGTGQLHNTGAVGEQQPLGVHGSIIRPQDARGHPPSAVDGGRERVERSLAAIRHRESHELVAGTHGRPASSNRGSGETG